MRRLHQHLPRQQRYSGATSIIEAGGWFPGALQRFAGLILEISKRVDLKTVPDAPGGITLDLFQFGDRDRVTGAVDDPAEPADRKIVMPQPGKIGIGKAGNV